MRHILSTALVALVVGALAGASVGAFAQAPQQQSDEPAAEVPLVEVAGLNADTVDGRHAVKATYNAEQRKNKLVATNRRGLLPSNIVKPKWELIRNMPAGFADGVDDVGPVGYLIQRFPCADPIDADGEYVIVRNLPPGMVHDFQVVPTGPVWLFIDRVEWIRTAEGTLTAYIRVDDQFDSGEGTCDIRHIAFAQGVTVAAAEQRLAGVKVGYAKNHPKGSRR